MSACRLLCRLFTWMILAALWVWMAVCVIAVFSGIGWLFIAAWLFSIALVFATQVWSWAEQFGRRE